MLKRVHPIAGTLALLTILTFWMSTVMVELFGTHEAIATVKNAIPWGFLVLIPSLAATGLSGIRLAGKSADKRIVRKKRRMPFIAANGIVILMPSAFVLSWLASQVTYGTLFYGIQMLELVAGATNITLMSMNMRDGLRLTRRLRSRQTATSS